MAKIKISNVHELNEYISKVVDDYIEERLEEGKGDGEEYRKFFLKTLKKFGVDDPGKIDQLSKKKKDKIFTYIEKMWTKENPETDDGDEYAESVEPLTEITTSSAFFIPMQGKRKQLFLGIIDKKYKNKWKKGTDYSIEKNGIYVTPDMWNDVSWILSAQE